MASENDDHARALHLHPQLHAAFAEPYFATALSRSRDTTLAAKAVKGMAYHVRHAAKWTIRLGDGTEESRRRAQVAIDDLWPFAGELFETDEAERGLIADVITVDPAPLRAVWSRMLDPIIAEATLTRPVDGWMQAGGRAGRHSEHLGRLLADL